MMARRLFLLGFAAALLTALGCSSSGGDGGASPAIACVDGGAAAANAITMTCAGATDSTTELVNVVLGGPASGTTSLRGLNFDVTYDPSKLTFVSATNYTGGPFSTGALVPATALPLDPTPHVVVSIQQVGGDPDVVIGAGQQVVMLHLSFARAPAATFGPTPLEFVNAEATVASPAITFASVSGLALSY